MNAKLLNLKHQTLIRVARRFRVAQGCWVCRRFWDPAWLRILQYNNSQGIRYLGRAGFLVSAVMLCKGYTGIILVESRVASAEFRVWGWPHGLRV